MATQSESAWKPAFPFQLELSTDINNAAFVLFLVRNNLGTSLHEPGETTKGLPSPGWWLHPEWPGMEELHWDLQWWCSINDQETKEHTLFGMWAQIDTLLLLFFSSPKWKHCILKDVARVKQNHLH